MNLKQGAVSGKKDKAWTEPQSVASKLLVGGLGAPSIQGPALVLQLQLHRPQELPTPLF